ncbi:ribosomal RNA small subunit methyltransferase E [Lachnospiraceae bacterium KM106-2]|nr:ribosomal RNA small subunit methyltransferase E [Lachnospiraceae bacterium KM106-2]
MNLFYVQKSQVSEQNVQIIGDDVNHIKNVLRMKIGEKIQVCDMEGTDYLCQIEEISPKEVIADIISKEPTQTELPAKVYLFQGLPKKDKMDLIIQKMVELGVYEVVPVSMKRCVVKIEDKKKEAKKLERWQSISESAAKQSKRGMIPEVTSVISFKEAINKMKELDINFFAYENAEGISHTRKMIEESKSAKTIGIIVGPEGGFDDPEVTLLQEAGIMPITLGKRILRTETAGFTMMAALMMELEQD